MSHRHHHHCRACHRPRHGLTAEQIFDTLTRHLAPGKIALRAKPLRRLARRIGTCDCAIRLFAPPPVAETLVTELLHERRLREAA